MQFDLARHHRTVVRWGRVLALLMLLSSGCASPWERSALLKDPTPNIARVQGPTERRLRNLMGQRTSEDDDSSSLRPLAGTEDYLAAMELYNDEEYAEAQKAFKKTAKKYKLSDIREDCLFMQAESAFQQEHYSKAHDSYALLLKEFPSTRHLDRVSERLFKIGRLWLDFPEVARLSEIQQVNFEDPKRKLAADEPAKKKGGTSFLPNFTNKAEPLFDTEGNGAAALQAIWMNDPTGPLADDAMMLVASHHARKGDWVEADRFFQMLRETFPNSPHLQDAFLLGSHVKLMSYQGPEYEGRTLEEAEKLKESTLRLYPNIADKARLKQELEQINEAKAARVWDKVELELRKKNKRGASIYCMQLMTEHPDSSFADRARTELEALGPEYASGAVLLSPTDPKKPTLLERLTPSRTQAAAPQQPPPRKAYADSSANDQSPARWNMNPFRKPMSENGTPVDGNEPEIDSIDPEGSQKPNWFRRLAPRRLPEDNDPTPAGTGRTSLSQ